MAEQLEIAFKIDSAEAQAGVAAVEKALGGVKTAAASAEAGLKGMDASVTALTGTLREKLTPATEKAFEAFAKMANAETPRALQRGIIDAQIAMDRFKTAVDQARASGEKIPSSVTAGMKTMQAEVDASTKKLGQLRDQQADVRVKADAMGQGWSQAASSGGSLNSMLNNLEASSGGAIQAMSRFALGAAGVFAAFELGRESGKKLISMFKEMGVDITVSGKAWAGFAGALAKITSDDKHRKWLEDLSHSTEGYGKLLEPLTGKMNESMKAHQALATQITAHNKALKDLGIDYHTAGEAGETLDKKIAALAVRFRDATKAGETLGGMAKANGAALNEIQKAVDSGEKKWNDLDATMKRVLQVHGELPPVLNTLTGGLQSLTEVNKAYEKSLEDIAEASKNMAASIKADQTAFDDHTAAMAKNAEAAKHLADSLGLVSKGLTAVRAEADRATDGLEGVAWSMRKATPATFELNDAQNELIESLAKISDAGGASSLWVGHLIAQLEAGEIGFDAFTQKVNQLLQELVKMGPVMGNTAQELNDINTLLGKFKNESTEGWPGPGRPT